ncbi:MAG TPA: DNA polymerase III subunit delta [Vicinamibacteria bacterium]|nr:DNA polymerase III subunit delta [Vicinamibacteria bacterium]
MASQAGPGPVHVVLGEDTYLAEQAVERILDASIGEDRREGLSSLDGDEERWEDVVSTARTGSLFVSRRAIVVRRADHLDGDEAKLAAYVSDPAPGVTLVLVAGKPDRRRNPWKKLLGQATVHDASPRKGRALRSYVEEELRARGLRLEPQAFEDLLGEVGQDLRRLLGEVDKLEAYAGGRREISADDVAAVLGRGLGQPLYRLSDGFAGRETAGCLELLERLLDDGEEGLRILSALHRALRQVRGARAMREARKPRAEIGARLLPAHMQFKLDALLEATRRWSEPDLRKALGALGRADARLKRGADSAATLVAAVVESCPTSPPRGQ